MPIHGLLGFAARETRSRPIAHAPGPAAASFPTIEAHAATRPGCGEKRRPSMYALHHGGPGSSPSTLGTSPRLRPTFLILSTLFCAALSQGAGAAQNLAPDGMFQSGLSYWRGSSVKFSPVAGGNAACIPLMEERKVDDNKPANMIYTADVPGVPVLTPNTRYKLSFDANIARSTSPYRGGWLMASVTGTERKIAGSVTKDPFGNSAVSGTYWPGVYAENQIRLTTINKTYTIDFVTPVQPKIDGTPTQIMFQALSSDDALPAADVCIKNVSLYADGTNSYSSVPSNTVIRYNTVRAGRSYAAQRFVILNPPSGGKVQMVRSGKVVAGSEKAISGVLTDPLIDGAEYFVYEVSPQLGGYSVRVANSSGAVVAETPAVTVANYSTAAPNLTRDALHFYYAHRSDQAIKDRRFNGDKYADYRNWFDRPAGHGGEKRDTAATCFNGVDNFGNDFNAACLTANAKAGAPVTFKQNVQGGWYDAGDHGKYVVNAAYTLWALQNVIELKRKAGVLDSEFPPNFLKYGNTARSDLLEEAKYEMEWLLKMQVTNRNSDGTRVLDPLVEVRVPLAPLDDNLNPIPNGQDKGGTQFDSPSKVSYTSQTNRVTYSAPRFKTTLKLSSINPEGLVFSAVHDSSWTGIPMWPDADKKMRVLDYPTTAATLDMSAVGAQCYRIWKDDPAEGTNNPTGLANRCLSAAKSAYAAAKANPTIYRYGEYAQTRGVVLRAITNGGGAYADTDVSDEFLWAATELYLATSETAYKNDMLYKVTKLRVGTAPNYTYENVYSCNKPKLVNFSFAPGMAWNRVNNLGLLSMLALGRDVGLTTDSPSCTMDKPSDSLKVVADNIAGEGGWVTHTSPWNVPVAVKASPKETFNWASNADIASAAVLLQTAEWAFPNVGYGKAASRVLDYLFGLNPLGKSYVTGYGSDPVRNPHHRHWAKHANINFPPAPPGLLVGGPNGKWTGSLLGVSNWNDPADGSALYMKNVVAKCNLGFDREWVNAELERPNEGGIACYADDHRLFMTNEIAINWNAPLFWLSAFVQ